MRTSVKNICDLLRRSRWFPARELMSDTDLLIVLTWFPQRLRNNDLLQQLAHQLTSPVRAIRAQMHDDDHARIALIHRQAGISGD